MAQWVEFLDPDGQKMKLLTVDDVMLPPMPGLDKDLSQLQDFKFRDDDIILTTYPRSGVYMGKTTSVLQFIQIVKLKWCFPTYPHFFLAHVL